jgi:hypothetical protein
MTNRRERRKQDRAIQALIRAHRDLFPAVVVHEPRLWRAMPVEQFDWAMNEIKKRRAYGS